MKGKSEALKGKEENIRKLEEKFILNSEYGTILDNITTTCKDCGHRSTKVARSFIKGGCQNCKKIVRKKQRMEKLKNEDNDFLAKVNDENENDYKIKHYRRGASDKLIVEHIPCGGQTIINNRNAKVVCNECNPEKLIDAEWYEEKYEKLAEEGYEVLDVIYGDYSKTRSRATNVLIKHLECGREYTRNSNTMKQPGGYKCPYCEENKRIRNLGDDDIDYKVKQALGEDYEYSHGYTNSKNTFYIKHKTCGNTYKTRLSTLSLGSGKCRECNKS